MKYEDFLNESRVGKRISVDANDLRLLKEVAETAAEKLGEIGSFPNTMRIALAITRVIRNAKTVGD